MDSAINNIGTSNSFDAGSFGAAQTGMQTDMNVSSVRMFSPGNMGDTQSSMASDAGHVAHAAHAGHASADGAAAQGAGGGGEKQGGDAAAKGKEKGSGMEIFGQIMDIIKSALSAAAPLIGMFGSLISGAGAGAGGSGTGGSGAA